MKKVIVVSKTHLDLGFTDYAKNIKEKYIRSFIPDAIDLAEKVNTDGRKNFVWTTGSWIIKEALKNPIQSDKLRKALQKGHIVPHAMPFTTHTELLDTDSLNYGLSIVSELDKLRDRKTVAAKMTDVPGQGACNASCKSRNQAFTYRCKRSFRPGGCSPMLPLEKR